MPSDDLLNDLITTLDKLVDAEIEAAPALTFLDMNSTVLAAFVTDMAQDLYSKPEICTRYGISMETMLDIVRRAGIARQIRERRAVFNSGESIQERNRAYFGVVAMEGATKLDKIIQGADTPAALVLEGITIASRNAGVYNSNANRVEGASQIGSQFSININFAGGHTERIGTTIDVRPEALTTVEDGA